MTLRRIPLWILAVVAAPAMAAEFAPVFTSGAVLQRDEPVAIWGTGRDGEKVVVEILDQRQEATVANGRWKVVIPPLKATDSTTLRLTGDSVVELSDVAVGEVWLLTGQSNMEWRLNQCAPHTDALLASANNPRIRQLKIPHRPYVGDPMPAFAWKAFDAASAPYFSAVGYYFAADIQRRLDVTVGLVNCSFGGTPIEAWMSRAAIASAKGQHLLDADEKKASAFPDAAAYEAAWNAFDAARKDWDARKKAGVPESELGPKPVEPYGFRTKSRPAGLRESMLSLITPYTARGVLWYQGENNAGRPEDYGLLLEALMTEVRSDWGRQNLPFFVAQISSPTKAFPDDQDAYAVVREAQRRVAASDPDSGIVVTLDYGEQHNVHPIQKQPIGERFARLAMAKAYGESAPAAQSPIASQARYGSGVIAIDFDSLPGRLVATDPAIPTLEVKSASGSWTPVDGKVSDDGKQIIIAWPASNPAPAAVRYGWRNFCILSLFSDEGLPASPWSLEISAAQPKS